MIVSSICQLRRFSQLFHQNENGASKRGAAPSFLFLPPLLRNALSGEGDRGGEVNLPEILRYAQNDIGERGIWWEGG